MTTHPDAVALLREARRVWGKRHGPIAPAGFLRCEQCDLLQTIDAHLAALSAPQAAPDVFDGVDKQGDPMYAAAPQAAPPEDAELLARADEIVRFVESIANSRTHSFGTWDGHTPQLETGWVQDILTKARDLAAALNRGTAK